MTVRQWTCQRKTNGVRCGTVNARAKQRCPACGGKRPATRIPAHRAILNELSYEAWVAWFGERCGICGAAAKPGGRRLHRDHDHRSGAPRGVLCFRCNSCLRAYMTLDWLRSAVDYLERAESLDRPPGITTEGTHDEH